MTCRFPIRSGTYQVTIGGAPDGLTPWEITLAELLSAQGYATGVWGKWAAAWQELERGFAGRAVIQGQSGNAFTLEDEP